MIDSWSKHNNGFIYLLVHMYTDILHRLQILRARSLYKQLPGFDQAKKKKTRNQHKPHVLLCEGYMFVRYFFFVRLCGSREIYILCIYTEINRYFNFSNTIQTDKADSRHSNSSTFAYCRYMTLGNDALSYSGFVKQLLLAWTSGGIAFFGGADRFQLENRKFNSIILNSPS